MGAIRFRRMSILAKAIWLFSAKIRCRPKLVNRHEYAQGIACIDFKG
jgi:hypothetical protein